MTITSTREARKHPHDKARPLESIQDHRQVWQSPRAISLIAQRRKASAFLLRRSQSFASLRHRFNQAMVRSTIHRFGRTTKRPASELIWRQTLRSAFLKAGHDSRRQRRASAGKDRARMASPSASRHRCGPVWYPSGDGRLAVPRLLPEAAGSCEGGRIGRVHKCGNGHKYGSSDGIGRGPKPSSGRSLRLRLRPELRCRSWRGNTTSTPIRCLPGARVSPLCRAHHKRRSSCRLC